MLDIRRGLAAGQGGAVQAPRPCAFRASRKPPKAAPAVCTAQARAVEAAQPPWSGDHWLSQFVNVLINTKPLYAVMKVLAKAALKNSAHKKGVQWDDYVRRLSSEASLPAIKAELENPAIKYPGYYLMPFHAYDEGNLSWLAAYEVEPATLAVSLRTFPNDKITPQEAFIKKRKAVTDALTAYAAQHGVGELRTIIDMGCSTGLSTRWLAQEFPEAHITGMDLSPYFLAVAEFEERQRMAAAAQQGGPLPRRIRYVHGLAEDCGLDSGSVDLITYQRRQHAGLYNGVMVHIGLVPHLLPPGEVITDLIKESARVLRKGGVLLFSDNNPASKTIQNLPPPIYTLLKSTEPHSDSYYTFDLEAAMRAAGFKSVITIPTDHRHRTVMGIAP